MQTSFPLLISTRARKGVKGAPVRLFSGNWIIDWRSALTRIALSINGSEPEEIRSGHKLTLNRDTPVQLTIIEPGPDEFVDAWAGRY